MATEKSAADKLRAAARRLKKRPVSAQPQLERRRTPTARMKYLQREHLPLLYSIESTLVTLHESNLAIDDATADRVLGAMIQDDSLEGEDELAIVALLTSQMQGYERYTPELGKEALLTVKESIARHSTLRPGVVTYMRWVRKTVRPSGAMPPR